VPTIERFPRSQKFLLGDRMQATALDVLEALIKATCTRDRRGHLARANRGASARWRGERNGAATSGSGSIIAAGRAASFHGQLMWRALALSPAAYVSRAAAKMIGRAC
jgi:hypothetical protein